MENEVETSLPRGFVPEGTTRAVRNQPDVRAAQDKPIDVPVYTYYERHVNKTTRDLLGWTIRNEVFTFGVKVRVKVGRTNKKLEVWIDRPGVPSERVYSFTADTVDGKGHFIPQLGSPPKTTAGNDSPLDTARFLNGKDLLPEGPHCFKCKKPDEGDLVDHEEKQYCMVCYIKGV